VEAAAHGTTVDEVSFHEVGAYDSIADIVGAAAALDWLSPASVSSSIPALGTGSVMTDHGPVPVPAPATASLLKGVPVKAEGNGELTTPTGAAILAEVVGAFEPPPPYIVRATGFGAGTKELSDRANVLRVILGEVVGEPEPLSDERVLVVKANIDDMSPQLIPSLLDALLSVGAIDVWATPVLMKKGRPAHEVAAMCPRKALENVQTTFFRESTTLGLRIEEHARAVMTRSQAIVKTDFGEIPVKVSSWAGEVLNAKPEYDACVQRAGHHGKPVRVVVAAAEGAARTLIPGAQKTRATRTRGR